MPGMALIEVRRGDEVLETVARECARLGITHGTLIMIGAVDRFAVSVMRRDDPAEDLVREWTAPAEIFGVGEVTADVVHIHASLGMEHEIETGHLHRAEVYSHFVRAYVQPFAQGEPETG